MKKIVGAVLVAALIFGSPLGLYFFWHQKVIELGEGLLALTIETLIVRPLDRLRQPSAFPSITSGYNDPRGRTPVPCGEGSGRTAVVVTFGQSNAANISPQRRRGAAGLINFNFLDGKCYVAADPLLGTSGDGGAVWTVFGNTLIARGAFERVILAPLAVGGTSVNRWSDRNELGRRLDRLGRALRGAALLPTHILWQQGAYDQLVAADYARLRPSEFTLGLERNGVKLYTMREDAYIGHFRSIVAHLREIGFPAPVYSAVSTICGDDGSGPVATAQNALPSLIAGVRAGPDLNAFPRSAYAEDHCHLSAHGVVLAGEAWAEIIAAAAN